MPVYDFMCDNCEHRFEQLAKVDQETATCPKCQKTAHQVPSVPAPFQWGTSGGWH